MKDGEIIDLVNKVMKDNNLVRKDNDLLYLEVVKAALKIPDDVRRDMGSVLNDAMTLYPGSRETPDYAVNVAYFLCYGKSGYEEEKPPASKCICCGTTENLLEDRWCGQKVWHCGSANCQVF